MRLLWEDRAWNDYLYWQNHDKKILKRVNILIKDICRITFGGIGQPEPLKQNLNGWWSRRIDRTNRIVYFERDGIIYIVSCRDHKVDAQIRIRATELERSKVERKVYDEPAENADEHCSEVRRKVRVWRRGPKRTPGGRRKVF